MPNPPNRDHMRVVDAPVERPEPTVVPLAPSLDTKLVARARKGDAGAWARLYRDNLDGLYRDVRYLVSDANTAEEIVQETFARALTSLSRFDGRASFRTWLRGIAHNLVRRRWRTRSRQGRAFERFAQSQDAGGASVAADPEAGHVTKRRAQVLSEVLTELPDALRETFIMRDVQGLSVDEVARRLSTTPNNVRVRANRARTKIRKRLSDLGWLPKAEVS